MLKNLIPILLLNLCFFTYGQQKETDLNEFFSTSEIKDLNLIADFFQLELCGNSDRTKFGECIKRLVPKIIFPPTVYISKNINYRKQKKLYRKISPSTFNKIWNLCETWRTIEPKYEYQRLCYGWNEDFKNFVLDLGKTSGYLSRYGRTLELGGLGNANYIASNIIDFPKSMNIDDRGVQIVFAIHYLTQNDHLKRDKKAIRLERRDLRKKNRELQRKEK